MEQERLRTHIGMYSNIGGGIFVLGSIFIISGKYFDAKKTNKALNIGQQIDLELQTAAQFSVPLS